MRPGLKLPAWFVAGSLLQTAVVPDCKLCTLWTCCLYASIFRQGLPVFGVHFGTKLRCHIPKCHVLILGLKSMDHAQQPSKRNPSALAPTTAMAVAKLLNEASAAREAMLRCATFVLCPHMKPCSALISRVQPSDYRSADEEHERWLASVRDHFTGIERAIKDSGS